MNIIFRRFDSLYVGTHAEPHDLDVEIQNLVQSELGGVAEDYIAVEVSEFPAGLLPVLQPNGSVRFDEKPDVVARREIRDRASSQLAALGLDPEVIQHVLN